MPRRLQLSEPASDDIDAIWRYTERKYNDAQAAPYMALLQQALDDIEENPETPTSRRHPDLGDHIRSYHFAMSKRRSGVRITNPRHVIIYTLEFEDEVFVLRILHEQMEAHRHLPGDYNNASELVCEALRLLKEQKDEHQARIAYLRAEMQEAYDAHERGEYIDLLGKADIQALRESMRRGRERLAREQNAPLAST